MDNPVDNLCIKIGKKLSTICPQGYPQGYPQGMSLIYITKSELSTENRFTNNNKDLLISYLFIINKPFLKQKNIIFMTKKLF